MSNRKFLLVSQVFHPDEQATSQLFSELLAALAATGLSCAVCCGFPGRLTGDSRGGRSERWRNIAVHRGGLRLDGKRNLAARALAYGSYCIWLAWRLLAVTPAETRVLVVTNPPFAPILVHWCSMLRGWTYDVVLHDVYPDGLVAVGRLSERSVFARLWRHLNRSAWGSAQHVLVLGRDMAELVERRYRIDPRKIVYVPNWSPGNFPDLCPAASTRLWDQLGLGRKFVVQYSGNMGLWHDVECIVRAAEMLRHEREFVFLMIGGGRRKSDAEQLSRKLSLDNMIWLPHQPKAQLNDSLACCQVALISQREGLEGVAVPSKLYGILASGRAVLAQVPTASEVALVLQEEGCGRVTAPGDGQALADAIRLLRDDPTALARMGSNSRRAYETKYTLGAAVAKFEEILHGKIAAAGY